MEPIRQMFVEIDLKTFGLTLFIVLLALQAIIKLIQWFVFDLLGIETRSMRERKEEHELLVSTANELAELSKRHQQDTEEIKQSFDEKLIEFYTPFREQSLAIQQELKDNIKAISDGADKRDQRIENLLSSQRESLGDKINRRFKYYLSIGGIPEDEVDEFISLHNEYKKLGGNHTGDQKFNYAMEHLDVIPVNLKGKIKE